jgi:hypothetical protein
MVSENRVLRRVFGPKREEVTEGQRKCYKEEFCNFHSLPKIIRVIKLEVMKCMGHITHSRKMRNVYEIFVGRLNTRDLLGRTSVDG